MKRRAFLRRGCAAVAGGLAAGATLRGATEPPVRVGALTFETRFDRPLLKRDGGPFNPYYVYFGGDGHHWPDGPDGYRWWGDELEIYTTDAYTPAPFNSSPVANGILSMTAIPAGLKYPNSPKPYLSSCLETSNGPWFDPPEIRATRGGFEQKYGYWEARIRVPRSKGIWPAFWLNGGIVPGAGNPNNRNGELDIFEMIGDGKVHQTAHDWWRLKHSGESLAWRPNFDHGAGFHTYGLHWTSASITWYVDGQATHRASDRMVARYRELCGPMFLVLNISVGGSWPGAPDGSTTFPVTMPVEFVRVYAPA